VFSETPDSIASRLRRQRLHDGPESGRDFRFLPELYALYGAMSCDAASDLGVEFGIDLRESGYGVWQA
jgi:hypothetical protein